MVHLEQQQDAALDGILRLRCRHRANWTKHSVVFDSRLFCPLYENMMSLTKPEVRYVPLFHQRRIDAQLQVTCREKLLKPGMWFLRYVSRQTDRHTDTLIWLSNQCLHVCLTINLLQNTAKRVCWFTWLDHTGWDRLFSQILQSVDRISTSHRLYRYSTLLIDNSTWRTYAELLNTSVNALHCLVLTLWQQRIIPRNEFFKAGTVRQQGHGTMPDK